MATKDTKAETGRGRGKGSGKGGGRASSGTFDTARRLQELDGHSVEAESNFEILRAQRAAARQGKKTFKDIRENEGVDEDDPLNSIDDGIRLEPFNMRREMREGHFDESGFYVLNKDEEKKVTDAWLDTVDQAERTATFKAAEKQNKASNAAANRLNAMAKNLGPDSEGEEDEDDKDDKDEKDEEEEKEKAKEAAKEEEEPEEDKEAEERNIINMLEELIVFLQPLETPAMALGRIRRGGTPKAQAEAAKAFAAEMKMSRNIARALVPEQGPEAAAIVNLNSEETRDVREKAMPKAPEEQPADGPPRPGQKRKQVSEGDVEKREKISRLTDLCNSLLERGVLVYDSARELLAIDVRQRKGEQLAPDADAKAPSAEAAPKAAAAKAATPTPEVQYTNKRFKAENGTSTAVTEMSDAATAAATVSAPASLFWQFRWGHNPGEINGPFDSVTMQGWVMQGCFSEDRPAEVRQCNERNEPQEQCLSDGKRANQGSQ
ncbi:CD2 antigen cytoplasmic tail-binding protein 2 (CD2 cytoplasmic domain-binding protein 2) (CD2 tail-binding protein 2) [Durusdinium trenchii]|uniref:CD2 antigen cytoplasmic tail-binding protein 2 (CD2 cytoplasmic domain-binding protein 2) (CD2 tail-binding protein 2) n=1 Tax=Durusdinium trenchii TaxID=1381693 RepID=A0ABP0JDU9_9DINO